MVEFDKAKEFETFGNMFQDSKKGMLIAPTAPVILRLETSKDGFTTLSIQYRDSMILATLTDEIKSYIMEVINHGEK